MTKEENDYSKYLESYNRDLKKQIKENIQIVEKSREPDPSDVNMEALFIKRDLMDFKERDKEGEYQKEIKNLEEKLDKAMNGTPKAVYNENLGVSEPDEKYHHSHGQIYIQ